METQASKVVIRAVQWWRLKAPAHYTVEQHLREPTVGCTGPAEYHLAQAVAEYVKASGGSEIK
jgi:hypothetical protein